MSIDGLKHEYVPKFLVDGEKKFYRFLLVDYSIRKLILMEQGLYKGKPPNLELLDYHDYFIILHRREGDEVYKHIAKMLRKAAHKVYRIMLKKNMAVSDSRFLRLV